MNTPSISRLGSCVLILALSNIVRLHAAEVTFVPGPGAEYAFLNPIQRATISDNGTATVTLLNADQEVQVLTWSSSSPGGALLATAGFSNVFNSMISEAGVTIGFGQNGTSYGALRWSAAGAVTQLEALNGAQDSRALAINHAGITVGFSELYAADGETFLGSRAVRWDPVSGTPTTLPLASSSGDFGSAQATAINSSGAIAGHGTIYIGGSAAGQRGIRWDNNGTTATTLNAISTDAGGSGFVEVKDINDNGIVIGNSRLYSGNTNLGLRAVRWDAGENEPTVLGVLGTSAAGGNEDTTAIAIDNSGNIAGLSQKYVDGVRLGTRPVIWKAGSTEPLELGILGTDANGLTRGNMSAMNNFGFVAGTMQSFDEAHLTLGRRAVVWGLDGTIYNLNDLIDAESGWTLTVATDISDTGWVAGYGTFDPDGSGPLDAYDRYFSVQVPGFAIPEPGTASLFLGSCLLLGFHRRRSA